MTTRRSTNTVARTMNDMGLAAWFGGSLMGAVGLNRAADSTDQPAEVSEAGWSRWTLVNALAIGSAAVGGLLLTKENRARIAGQTGVATTAALKAALLGGAAAASLYARVLGRRIAHAEHDGAVLDGTTTPGSDTPADVASAQHQLKLMQWVVPALTGATIVVDSRLSEQQRPMEVVRGTLQRLNPAA
jgi:hypothetical protein